jgi:hypothetical protein
VYMHYSLDVGTLFMEKRRLSEGQGRGWRTCEQRKDRERSRKRRGREPLNGFDPRDHSGKYRRRHNLDGDMCGRAEGAIGMRGGVARVTVSRLEGAAEEDQEDT